MNVTLSLGVLQMFYFYFLIEMESLSYLNRDFFPLLPNTSLVPGSCIITIRLAFFSKVDLQIFQNSEIWGSKYKCSSILARISYLSLL